MAEDKNSLLDQFEAAHLLGITPELLFAYIRYAPKGGNGRKLEVTQHDGQTHFLRCDLLSFDEYLKEPWSELADDRATIPTYVVTHLKVESGSQCPRCGRGFKLETAHILDYAISRSHHHHNLIRLCTLCHEEFDDKKILPKGEIESIKARLIARTRERVKRGMELSILDGFRPPTPTDVFLGRESLVAQIAKALTTKRLVCINGPGGMGKTQLALHVLPLLGEQCRTMWLDLESLGSIGDISLVLASALTGSGEHNDLRAISHHLELQIDLIVFDGIESLGATDLEAFENLVSQLAASTRLTRFLVTSQCELLNIDGLLSIEIPILDEGVSINMLQVIAGSVTEMVHAVDLQAIHRLVDFAGGHPLSLRIIANLLRYFKSPTVVADRVKSMGAAAITAPNSQKTAKHRSLDACFFSAYAVLQSDERRLLFLLSHCPAGRFSTHLDGQTFGISDMSVAIAELARWHLITVDTAWSSVPRIHVLSPVRAFAKRAFQEQDALLAETLFYELSMDMLTHARVLDDRYTSEGDVGRSTQRLSQEFPNLSYIFDEAQLRSPLNPEYERITFGLAFSLQVFCFVSGRSERGLQLLNAGVIAALNMEQVSIASSLMLQIANFAERMGDSANAREALCRICSLPNDNFDPELGGNIAFAKGMLTKVDGNLEKAQEHFAEASQLYGQTVPAFADDTEFKDKPANERMQALALMERARIYEHSGRQNEALEIYECSLSLMRAINDRVNIGTVLHQMGNCYANLEQFENAYKSYVESTRCFFHLGSAIHLSNSLSELGYVLIDYDPGSSLLEALSEEMVQAGLVDIYNQCRDSYRPSLLRLEVHECVRLIRKLFGIVSLVSFTQYESMLEEFADNLRNVLAKPLTDQLVSGGRRGSGENLVIMHLDVTAAMALSLSAVDSRSQPSIDEIGHFAMLCYTQSEPAWHLFRLFDWLAVYLKRKRAYSNVSSARLIKAAAVCSATDEPFEL